MLIYETALLLLSPHMIYTIQLLFTFTGIFSYFFSFFPECMKRLQNVLLSLMETPNLWYFIGTNTKQLQNVKLVPAHQVLAQVLT